ncbi:peptide deformylase [Alkalithermobacter paradoxus]|uniref:Peptide deformylase n=1 Tax=Alkalithermobacter paradoxus TaxID=29349 RepID=A0A1V4IB77_9FIRM|nr:peptide deformylase 1 [[Clostridium] thermoalcaliphilum]
MALRIIKKDNDPVLRKKSRVVENIDQKIITLLEDMAETMYHADGVGLAAPQIGILKRVIVVDVGDGLIELINPEIIEQRSSQTGEEGCLSVPGKYGKVKRPLYVKVRGLNRNGETVIVEGKDLLARALCHEIDHLDGILFIDRVEGRIEEN